MRLAIVRGHRISAQGATAANGDTEWQWAGWLASWLAMDLQRADLAGRVFERPDGHDYRRNLHELTTAINAWRPDLVLAIHFDASPNGEPWSGSSALHWPGSREGRRWALRLSAAAAGAIGIPDRGARPQAESWAGAPLYILRDTDAPAVLLETHFGGVDHGAAVDAMESGALSRAIVDALTVRTT